MRAAAESWLRSAVAGWRRFWFEPVPTSTLAVVRILVGFTTFAWSLSLAPELFDFFGREGIVTSQPAYEDEGSRGSWGVLGIFESDAAALVLLLVTILASAALMLGLFTRIAAILVFVGVMSFERRNPWVFNSGDTLVRILAFYMVLAPAGAALSLDRLRKAKDRFWEFPLRAPWALRLIQIQLSIVYISAVWDKVQGTTWNDGTATSYAFQLFDHERFPLPSFCWESLLLTNLLTFGTLAVELAMGILVWNRAMRPIVMAAGIGLHLGIDYRIRVAFFTFAILTPYVAFVQPERMNRLLIAVRDRVRAGRRREVAGDSAGPATGVPPDEPAGDGDGARLPREEPMPGAGVEPAAPARDP